DAEVCDGWWCRHRGHLTWSVVLVLTGGVGGAWSCGVWPWLGGGWWGCPSCVGGACGRGGVARSCALACGARPQWVGPVGWCARAATAGSMRVSRTDQWPGDDESEPARQGRGSLYTKCNTPFRQSRSRRFRPLTAHVVDHLQ